MLYKTPSLIHCVFQSKHFQLATCANDNDLVVTKTHRVDIAVRNMNKIEVSIKKDLKGNPGSKLSVSLFLHKSVLGESVVQQMMQISSAPPLCSQQDHSASCRMKNSNYLMQVNTENQSMNHCWLVLGQFRRKRPLILILTSRKSNIFKLKLSYHFPRSC